MSTAFRVVMRVRQHFGNNPATFSQFPFGPVVDDVAGGIVQSAAGGAPFVGASGDYVFDCPGVNPFREAVLMFQSLGVQHEGNLLEINPGTAAQPSVFGGIPVIPAIEGRLPTWSSNVLIIGPRVLMPEGNVLHIESRPLAGEITRELDDFVIDNAVVFYSTEYDGVFDGPPVLKRT